MTDGGHRCIGPRQQASVRVDRKHLGVGCGIRRPRRHHLRGIDPQGKIAMASWRRRSCRRQDHPDRRQLRRCLELARKMAADFPTISLVTRSTRCASKVRNVGVRDRRRAGRGHPTCHALPVGNAGNLTAYWKGYTEYHREGLIESSAHLGPRRPARPPLCWANP